MWDLSQWRTPLTGKLLVALKFFFGNNNSGSLKDFSGKHWLGCLYDEMWFNITYGRTGSYKKTN